MTDPDAIARPSAAFQTLLRLARDRSPSGRLALFRDVGGLAAGALTAAEQDLVADILIRLFDTTERPLRRRLADRVSRDPRASHRLAVALARDHISVAFPVVVHSAVLQDEDLLGVVADRTFEHRLATATRSPLHESVADALARHGHPQILHFLARNPGARLSRQALETMVDAATRDPRLSGPVMERPDLPRDLARRLAPHAEGASGLDLARLASLARRRQWTAFDAELGRQLGASPDACRLMAEAGDAAGFAPLLERLGAGRGGFLRLALLLHARREGRAQAAGGALARADAAWPRRPAERRR